MGLSHTHAGLNGGGMGMSGMPGHHPHHMSHQSLGMSSSSGLGMGASSGHHPGLTHAVWGGSQHSSNSVGMGMNGLSAAGGYAYAGMQPSHQLGGISISQHQQQQQQQHTRHHLQGTHPHLYADSGAMMMQRRASMPEVHHSHHHHSSNTHSYAPSVAYSSGGGGGGGGGSLGLYQTSSPSTEMLGLNLPMPRAGAGGHRNSSSSYVFPDSVNGASGAPSDGSPSIGHGTNLKHED